MFAYPFRHTASMEGNKIVPKNATAEDDASVPDPDLHAADGNTVAARALEAEREVGRRGIIIAGTLEADGLDRPDLRLL